MEGREIVISLEPAGADIFLIEITIPFYLLLVYIQEFLETHLKVLQSIFSPPHVDPSSNNSDEDVKKEAQAANCINPKDVR